MKCQHHQGFEDHAAKWDPSSIAPLLMSQDQFPTAHSRIEAPLLT